MTKFEDLQAWQAARRLAGLACSATSEGAFRRNRGLADQLRRAATSTASNIAEGFASGSHSEFRRFLRYSIRSAAEVQSCLYLAVDQGALSDTDFKQLYNAAERVKGLSSALTRRLATRPERTRPKPPGVSEASADWVVNQTRYPRDAPGDADGSAHVHTSARPHVHTGRGAADQ